MSAMARPTATQPPSSRRRSSRHSLTSTVPPPGIKRPAFVAKVARFVPGLDERGAVHPSLRVHKLSGVDLWLSFDDGLWRPCPPAEVETLIGVDLPFCRASLGDRGLAQSAKGA